MLHSRCDIENILHRVSVDCQPYNLSLQIKLAGLALYGALLLFGPRVISAQSAAPVSDLFQIGAQAIGVATRVSPAVHGQSLTEGYVTQPIVMAELTPWAEALTLRTTIDFEGATIERGEL